MSFNEFKDELSDMKYAIITIAEAAVAGKVEGLERTIQRKATYADDAIAALHIRIAKLEDRISTLEGFVILT